MGRVMATVKLANAHDYFNAEAGIIPREDISRAEVEALVDTGANMLVLPQEVVQQLGLIEIQRRKARYADGRTAVGSVVSSVRLEIAGREGEFDALAENAGAMPLIGQVVLEELDLVVDPRSRELRPNPESPDMPTIDVF
jgi:clan AA aspartic protease